MESEEQLAGSFLPAYFPSPAPRLVLSRPGTQQYGPPMPDNRSAYAEGYTNHQQHGPPMPDNRSAYAEGYMNHQLPQQHGPPMPDNRSAYAEGYTNYKLRGPQQIQQYIERRTDPHYIQPTDDRSSHTRAEGRNYPLPASSARRYAASGQHWDLNQPPYVPSPSPFYEPTSLYGLYIPSENHRDTTEAGFNDATGSRANRLNSQLPQARILASASTSTPILYRMSAKRPPGERSYIPAPQLESCLKKDLDGNVIITLPTFFLDELWPVDTLSCVLDEKTIFNQLARNEAWDTVRDCFVIPPTSFTEFHMAEWLNKLGGLIGAYTGSGFERKRSWCAKTQNKQPSNSDSGINRKPDLILVDRSFVDKLPDDSNFPSDISWNNIDTFAEVTRSCPFPKRIFTTINDKSYVLFVTQHDRRFVPALSFNGQGMFALTLTDRQGQISMPPMPFLHGKGNAFMFMKILTCLMYGPVHNAGRDTTMELHPNGRIKSISVNTHWYNVVYLVYSLQSLIGRGTNVWLVNRNGKHFILKDSWIQDSRVESEITFLKMLKGDPKLKDHVPDLVEGEDIHIGGTVDSTGRYRDRIGGMHDSRRHRRLVMSPIGKQITTFQSMSEFIRAIIDIIEG
jgi:hypothetical protein